MDQTNKINMKSSHQLIQPLNIIRLSCGNILARMSHHSGEDSQYIIKAVGRIEEQVIRATQILHKLEERDEEQGLRGDD